jgi:hypothetical protein
MHVVEKKTSPGSLTRDHHVGVGVATNLHDASMLSYFSLTMSDPVRAWPCSTGGFELGLIYMPEFVT